EHTAANRLDANEAFDHGLAVLGLRRRQTLTTLADHDRRDTVQAGRGAQRIPKQLSVEMGVRINKTRRQGQAIHIQRLFCAAGYRSDLHDLPTRDGHITVKTWHARAVINPSTFNNEV